jgi:hypothetical protein
MGFLSSLRRTMPELFEGSDGSPEPEEPLSPLHAAVDAEDVDQVRQLAVTADPVDLTAALCRSCQCGKINSAQALLETGRCDANAVVEGDTVLFLADEKNRLGHSQTPASAVGPMPRSDPRTSGPETSPQPLHPFTEWRTACVSAKSWKTCPAMKR